MLPRFPALSPNAARGCQYGLDAIAKGLFDGPHDGNAGKINPAGDFETTWHGMIEFQHVITQSEVDSQYINLTDKGGIKYGKQMGKLDKVLTVIDESGKKFEMKRIHGNQLSRCGDWLP